jgi:hypothetical protein
MFSKQLCRRRRRHLLDGRRTTNLEVVIMAHEVVADIGHHHGATIPVSNDTVLRHKRTGIVGTLSLIPGFAYILALFIIGALMLPDPRAALIEIGPFKLSWVEIILLLSAVIASAEILKVSEPGVDNTGEVIAMGLVAVIQFGLVIASLYDQKFAIFKTTESLMMLIINGVQTYVAFRINSRSLVRTIAGGSVTG